MIRYAIGAFALGCITLLASTNTGSAAKDAEQAMRFEWRVQGPATQCGNACRRWIAAVGVVTDHTARDFETFARNNDVRGATLVLDSEGGSVLAAMALGRAIRKLDI